MSTTGAKCKLLICEDISGLPYEKSERCGKDFVQQQTGQGAVLMAKYKVYRTQGRIDKDIRKHELVAVEEGSDIFSVTDEIINAVVTDLAESEEFSHCTADAYAPEPVEWFRKSDRYDYYVCGIVMPEHAEKNIIIEYGIIEETEKNV